LVVVPDPEEEALADFDDADEVFFALVPALVFVPVLRVEALVEGSSTSGSPSNTATEAACAFALFLFVIGPLLDLVTCHPT
jgi:hypothetical protein